MEGGSTEASLQPPLLQEGELAQEGSAENRTAAANASDNNESLGDRDGHDSPTRTKYWKSMKLGELLLCFTFWFSTWAVFKLFDIEPYQRPIPFQYLDNSGDYIRNLTNNESREGDSISASILVFIAELVQLCLCLVHAHCWHSGSSPSSLHANVHSTLCVFWVANALNRIATESVKNYTGYLRPIFYEECVPDDQYQGCTSDDIGEGIRKSFPSGHSSSSFVGFTLLTLFIHANFGYGNYKRIQDQKRLHLLIAAARHSSDSTSIIPDTLETDAVSSLRARVISTLALFPMGVATYIAAQRVRYNMHFPADVVGGSIMGGGIAVFVHGLWF